MYADFQKSFTVGFSKKFSIKHLSCYSPHRNCVATLLCETWNATFIILPLQLLRKLTLKSIQFLQRGRIACNAERCKNWMNFSVSFSNSCNETPTFFSPWQIFHCKFLAGSNGKRILKIDQHLAKLLTKNIVGLFYDSQCTAPRDARNSVIQ